MYGKLFAQMYDGTLATKGPWQALVTFQQMIVLCDRRGIVDMTAEALSRRTTIPLEIIDLGIVALEQPDSESRTPDLEGRRIVRLSEHRVWGWQIVNYEHYRKIRSDEERNEYQRNLMRKRRAVSKDVSSVSEVSTCSKQYAVSKEVQEHGPPSASPPPKKAPSEKRAARLPTDWDLPDTWQKWAVEAFHAEPQKVFRIGLDFRDYWHAKPGRDGVKLDWLATWRRWCRRELENA